ncbi:hypothetical protein V1264_022345 [Littorina saxatilis]|uniref:Uncharacterized protein n=1 Tax=Littorina saxatilis TaxID=31220 RepID=A0AAN9AK36_9CAEN
MHRHKLVAFLAVVTLCLAASSSATPLKDPAELTDMTLHELGKRSSGRYPFSRPCSCDDPPRCCQGQTADMPGGRQQF